MSDQQRNQTEDVKENLLKGLIIVDIEPVTVKHHCVWMNKADENSQYLETYDAMRKMTENEREARDPIMVQINKYVCNGRRRYCRILILFSRFGFLGGPKVEAEMFCVKMHQTKAISWNQAKSGDDAAEKFVSNDDKKLLAEATQSLENVLEQLSKLSQMQRKVHQVKEELSPGEREGQRQFD